MKRCLPLFLVLAALAVSSGCAHRNTNIPSADIPFAEASYEVLGKTNAESCGTYFFGVDFVHLFRGRSTTIDAALPFGLFGLLSPTLTPEASRALYDALEKIPEATHLVAPRVHNSRVGINVGPFFLFGRRCAVVDARGVVIGEEPNIQGEDLGRLIQGE